MTSYEPQGEQTPDARRAARDNRWAQIKSMHWRSYVPAVGTRSRAAEADRVRATKPTRIPSQAPSEMPGA